MSSTRRLTAGRIRRRRQPLRDAFVVGRGGARLLLVLRLCAAQALDGSPGHELAGVLGRGGAGLLGEILDGVGDDGEAPASDAAARRLDAGVDGDELDFARHRVDGALDSDPLNGRGRFAEDGGKRGWPLPTASRRSRARRPGLADRAGGDREPFLHRDGGRLGPLGCGRNRLVGADHLLGRRRDVVDPAVFQKTARTTSFTSPAMSTISPSWSMRSEMP